MTVPSSSLPVKDNNALIGLLLGALAIAFAPIFVRLSEVGPSATAFYRILFALPALWVWMTVEQRSPETVRTKRKPQDFADYWRLGLCGLFFALDLAFWHWSIRFTSVANSTLLANFAPIFVSLGGYILFKQRFSRTFMLGLFLAILGACVLMSDSFSLSPDHLFGDFLALCTALFYGSYILSVGRLRAHFSTATIMTWSGAITAIILLPIALVSGEVMVAPTLWGWGVLLGLALFSHAGGQSLIAYALAHLPAAFSSVSLLLQPACAAVLAWVLLDEPLGALQAVGAAIIMFGVYSARKGSK